MKIEIDFDKKTIVVKDQTTLGALVDKLKELKLDWKEFVITAESTWTYIPWTTQPYTPAIYPVDPLYTPYKVTCTTAYGLTKIN